MYKASPIVPVDGWAKASATAAETTVASASFVSISTSYNKMSAGKATITNALIPDFQLYDRGRVVIGGVDGVTDDDTLELLGLDADGNQWSLGTSVAAGGAFPAIEWDIQPMKLYLRVAVVSGTLSLVAGIQGFYRAASTTT